MGYCDGVLPTERAATEKQEHVLLVLKAAPAHRGQGETRKEEADCSRLAGGRLISKELTHEARLRQLQNSRSPHPPHPSAGILNVERGLSRAQSHAPVGGLNTFSSPGCILENGFPL